MFQDIVDVLPFIYKLFPSQKFHLVHSMQHLFKRSVSCRFVEIAVVLASIDLILHLRLLHRFVEKLHIGLDFDYLYWKRYPGSQYRRDARRLWPEL